jgi:hypothetical protein
VPHLQQDVAFLQRQLGVASGVGVGKACQRGPGSERLVGVGTDVGENLKEGIDAQVIGVVMVGIAGEQGIDFLGEDGLDRVVNVFGGARVGQKLGEAGDDAQGPFEGADGEEPASETRVPPWKSTSSCCEPRFPRLKWGEKDATMILSLRKIPS